jgi:AMP nucleosidase
MVEGSKIHTPDARPETAFYDPDKAVAYLNVLYQDAVGFLQSRFDEVLRSGSTGHRYRAFYPQISVQVDSFRSIDSRLSFGHVTSPGSHTTTITRPDLFSGYLRQQIELLVENHDSPILIVPMRSRRIRLRLNRSPFC